MVKCHGKSAQNGICWLSGSYQWIDDHPPIWLSSPSYDHDTHDQTRLVIPIAISQGKSIAAWTGNPVSGTPNITKNSYMLIPERRIPLSGKWFILPIIKPTRVVIPKYIWEIQVSHIETFWERVYSIAVIDAERICLVQFGPPSSGDMGTMFSMSSWPDPLIINHSYGWILALRLAISQIYPNITSRGRILTTVLVLSPFRLGRVTCHFVEIQFVPRTP